MSNPSDNHEHAHLTKGTMLTIFGVLFLLTVVEVAVPFAFASEYDKYLKVSLLVVLALAKAFLVGLYFMHLKWEKPWVKRIALMPVYLVIAAVILMLESVYR